MSRLHTDALLPRRLVAPILAAAVLLGGCAGAQASDTTSHRVVAPAPPAKSAPSLYVQEDHSGEPVIPDRLEIPAIDANLPVVKLGWHTVKTTEDAIFSEWDVAEYAAGWHKNSALPGERGNVVMSGHNNILGAVFRELDQVRAGDEAVVWKDGERYVYKVDQVLIVPEKHATEEQRADNAKWIGEFDDDRLTLVSCWPRNNNSHRIIVVAHPAGSADTVQSSMETSGP